MSSRSVGAASRLRIGLVIAIALAGCQETEPAADGSPSQAEPGIPESGIYVPDPDLSDMEPRVASRLEETRSAVLAQPLSPEAWGRFGMVAHAHELWDEAMAGYRRAESLDPTNPRWPYYQGDVLSVLGTDLEAAAAAFRRSMDLEGNYPAAHMRLGRVLLADDQPAAAEEQLERALELDPDLQPAEVSLAQIRLSQGRLAEAQKMLDHVLATSPRHAQALSTLGQVYMRQGRRDEARQVAERARDAALYNLFSDPLMGPVVNEGVSSVLLWDRAKAFYDNGNFEQAAKGLEQVVRLLPASVEAHHQLAIAYSNLGQPRRSKPHLQRAIALDPELIDPRVQLASIHLDEQDPSAAIPHLRAALKLDPEDPDAGWLLGRALVITGQLEGGLGAFEAAHRVATAEQRPVPGWAHNEWGSALAQTGRLQKALNHFEAALAANPDDAQALFYAGLVHEGQGQIRQAVELYCRAMKAQPNPPAAERLTALGGTCG